MVFTPLHGDDIPNIIIDDVKMDLTDLKVAKTHNTTGRVKVQLNPKHTCKYKHTP
jgi:hypothetical protein